MTLSVSYENRAILFCKIAWAVWYASCRSLSTQNSPYAAAYLSFRGSELWASGAGCDS